MSTGTPYQVIKSPPVLTFFVLGHLGVRFRLRVHELCLAFGVSDSDNPYSKKAVSVMQKAGTKPAVIWLGHESAP